MLSESVKWLTKEDGSLINVKLGSIYIIRPPFTKWNWLVRSSDSNPSLIIAIPVAMGKTLTSFYVICIEVGRHPVIEYYLKNSEVILGFCAVIHILRPVFRKIRKDIEHTLGRPSKKKASKGSSKRGGPKRKKREENLVKMCEGAIDKILEAMGMTNHTSIIIGRKKFFLFDGRMECKDQHIAKIELYYIKRLMDISEWPWRAILWWRDLHLRLANHLVPTSTTAEFVRKCQQAFINHRMNSRGPKKGFSDEERQMSGIGIERSMLPTTDTNVGGRRVSPSEWLCIVGQATDEADLAVDETNLVTEGGHDVTLTHASSRDLELGRMVSERGERELIKRALIRGSGERRSS